MSNVVPVNVQVPAHLASRIGAPSILGTALTGGLLSGADFPRISIKACRFRIKDGDAETVLDSTTLNVVIVGANPRLSKTWYAKEWDADAEPVAPDCFSLDGISHDSQADDPQNDLCASCAHNAWGSKVTPTGKPVKACSDKKRLAIVSAEDAEGPIYLLEVTPSALKGLNQYQKELSIRGIPPEIVKTTVSFDTAASFPKLKFTFGGFLDAEVQKIVDGLFGSERVKEITGEDFKVAGTQIMVPATPKIKPVEAAIPEAKAVEPTAPKRGFSAPKVESVTPKVKPAEPTVPKRGFGAPKAKSVVPVSTAATAASLADEIAALVGEVSADDA